MSQHIEIEFKNLLTHEEFTRLKTFLTFDDKHFKQQINHYFDTAHFSLKGQGCALRIREKEGAYELTLKQPAKIGLLETNQPLQTSQVESTLKTGEIPSGPVKDALSMINQQVDSLMYFGSLITKRAEKEYKGGLIVLDHSIYLNTEDFEVEYEVEDEKSCLVIFRDLLSQLQITERKTENKIMRFYKQKYLEMNQNEG